MMPVIPHFASESLELIDYKGEIKWPSVEKELLLVKNKILLVKNSNSKIKIRKNSKKEFF